MIKKIKTNQFDQRIFFIYLIILIILTMIINQLWYLQVKKWDYYKEQASQNRIRIVDIPAPRGRVFDRNGRILVDNRPRYDLIATIEDVKDPKFEAKIISQTLNQPYDKIYKRITDKIYHRPFEPSVLLTDLKIEDVIKISEKDYMLPGVDLQILPVRNYVNGKTACHILGYTGKISEAEFDSIEGDDYSSRDEIGKFGIEESFERALRGKKGARQIQVTSTGHMDKVIGEIKPVKGYDVYLTIDLKMQKLIENAYEGRNGAAVVLEVATGDVIALVSQPGFNPNAFTTGDYETIKDYFVSETFPLLNRVITTTFAPGSIFKPIVALAALGAGTINEQTSVFCSGEFHLGSMTFKCWKKWGHGETNITRAIEQSCNVFFYNVGKEIGFEPIYKTGKIFGLGEKTGIQLSGEKPGLLPNEEWKKKYFKAKDQQKWHLGDSINYAIGQGYLLVTPIQMACVTSAIATNGFLPTPNLLYKIINNQNIGIPFETEPSPPKKLDLEQVNLDMVRIGMLNVIQAKYGTGRKARVEGIRAAGKTGTAQIKTRKGNAQNAWFICFAPFENPKIALAILVEGGESGGEAAAPIAKKILSSYFNIQTLIESENKEKIVTEVDNVSDVTQSVGDDINNENQNLQTPQQTPNSNQNIPEAKPKLWTRIKNIFNFGDSEE